MGCFAPEIEKKSCGFPSKIAQFGSQNGEYDLLIWKIICTQALFKCGLNLEKIRLPDLRTSVHCLDSRFTSPAQALLPVREGCHGEGMLLARYMKQAWRGRCMFKTYPLRVGTSR